MAFDELYKKVIDACRKFEERGVPISLDFKIEDLRDALVESNDTIEKLKAKNKRLKRALYKAIANWASSERYTEATWHGDEHREELWAEVEVKCRAKAEEY